MIKSSVGMTHENMRVLGAVMALVVATMVAITAFGIAFQEFTARTFHSAEPYTIVNGISLAIAFCLLLFLPNVMQKYSSKNILMWMGMIMGGSMILFDQTYTHEWSYAFPIIVLVFSKLFITVTTTVIHHHLSDSIRSTFQGIYEVFFGLGLAASPAFVNYFRLEVSTLYIVTALSCIIFLIPIMFLRIDKDVKSEKKGSGNAPKTKWYDNFSVMNDHPILYLVLFAVSVNGSIAALIVFVGNSYHLDTLALNHVVEIFMLGGVILSIPAGILADRFGILRVFMGCLSLAVIVAAVLALDTGNQGLNKCMLFLLGGTQSNFYLLVFAFIGRKFKEMKLAKVNSGATCCILLSNILFIQLYGWLLDGYGHTGFMYVVCATNFTVLAAFLIVTRGYDDTARLKKA